MPQLEKCALIDACVSINALAVTMQGFVQPIMHKMCFSSRDRMTALLIKGCISMANKSKHPSCAHCRCPKGGHALAVPAGTGGAVATSGPAACAGGA